MKVDHNQCIDGPIDITAHIGLRSVTDSQCCAVRRDLGDDSGAKCGIVRGRMAIGRFAQHITCLKVCMCGTQQRNSTERHSNMDAVDARFVQVIETHHNKSKTCAYGHNEQVHRQVGYTHAVGAIEFAS